MISLSALVSLALFGLLAVGAGAYVSLLIHRPSVAIWSLVAISVLTEGLRDRVVVVFSLGPANVGALDVAVVVLAGLAGYRMFARRFAGMLVPASLLALVALHLLRGIGVHGFQAAVNSSRSWLYFAVAFAFAVTVKESWHRDALRAIVAGGVGLAAFALYNVARTGVAVAGTTFFDGSEWRDARVVTAAGSLLILSALLILFTTDDWSPVVRLGGSLLCGAALVLIPHRTVWVAATVAAIVLFVGWSRARVRRAPELVYGYTGVLFLAAPVVVWLLTQSPLVRGSLATATGQGSTLAWRTDSWRELLKQHDSPEQALFGSPAGVDWTRLIGDTATAAAPHNSYVESYLRFGLAGIAVVIGVALLAFVGARTARTGAPAYLLAALVVINLMYGLTYQFAMVCGLALGIVAHGAIGRVRAPRLADARHSWHPVA